MSLGPPDGSGQAMKLPEAAAYMGIKIGTAKAYLHLPASRQLFLQLCAALREGEIPANLRAAIAIRDNPAMAASAAGSRAIIEAARYIENGGKENAGVTVNLGMAIGVNAGNIAPGYLVGLPAEYVEAGRKLLKAARSTKNVLDREGASDAVLIDEGGPSDGAIDHDGPETPAMPEPLSVDSPRSAFDPAPFEHLAPRDSRRRAPLVERPTADVVQD